MTKAPIKLVVVAAWVSALVPVCAVVSAASEGTTFGTTCSASATSASCLDHLVSGELGAGGIFIYIYAILACLGLILGLAKTARSGRWGWFILIFFTSMIGLTIYALVGPEDKYRPYVMPSTPYNPYDDYPPAPPPTAYYPYGGYPPPSQSAPYVPGGYPPTSQSAPYIPGGYPPANPPNS